MQVFNHTAGWYLSKSVRRWHWHEIKFFMNEGSKPCYIHWGLRVYFGNDALTETNRCITAMTMRGIPLQDGNTPVIGTLGKLTWFVLNNCCISLCENLTIPHFLLGSTELLRTLASFTIVFSITAYCLHLFTFSSLTSSSTSSGISVLVFPRFLCFLHYFNSFLTHSYLTHSNHMPQILLLLLLLPPLPLLLLSTTRSRVLCNSFSLWFSFYC